MPSTLIKVSALRGNQLSAAATERLISYLDAETKKLLATAKSNATTNGRTRILPEDIEHAYEALHPKEKGYEI
jgi:histone H3/H4